MTGLSFVNALFPEIESVRGLTTTRAGGCSTETFKSLNLATHVGDDNAAVRENRRRLAQALDLPAEPVWLDQCHGTAVTVVQAGSQLLPPPQTDAAITREPHQVLAVLSADCLPILLCAPQVGAIAVAHAGWRGLANGVVENTVAAMAADAMEIYAWLGPAIGPGAFEVGEDVRAAFVKNDAAAARHFQTSARDKWLADLAGLARDRLQQLGITKVTGADLCTYSNPDTFFSFRRDGQCGRMASLLWMSPR